MSNGADGMELERIEIDKCSISAKETLTLPAETQLQIRYRVQGEDITTLFSEAVPAGKQWVITIRLNGEETDE